MLHKKNDLGTRRVSPPTPVFMSSAQKASYLADLRTNRPSRPVGSRPLPARPSLLAGDENMPPRSGSALSLRSETSQMPKMDLQESHTQSKRASMPSAGTFTSRNSFKGRPLVQSINPSASVVRRKVSPTMTDQPENPYRESTIRLKEKQEAHALREALEKLDRHDADADDDEQRLHEAAKSEAADLVWRHRNPQASEAEKTAPYRNPDLGARTYGELGREKKTLVTSKPESLPNSRSSSGESTTSQTSKRKMLPWLRRRTEQQSLSKPQQNADLASEPRESEKPARKISGGRQVSSGSSKGLFRNPEDQIYEEPEDDEGMQDQKQKPPATVEPSQQNRPSHVRPAHGRPFHGVRPLPTKTQSLPVTTTKSRVLEQDSTIQEDESDDIDAIINGYRPESPETPMKDGLEIRSEEIRAATSMKKKDRSPNLPTPTAVSDRPGRPIVSFDPKWRPSTDSPRTSNELSRPHKAVDTSIPYPVPDSTPTPIITILEAPSHEPMLSNGAPSRLSGPTAVPSINISVHEPPSTIQPAVPTPSIPMINLPDEEPDVIAPTPTRTNVSSDRPLPVIAVESSMQPIRPLPTQTRSSPSRLPPTNSAPISVAARVPWLHRTPTASSATSVACNACSLPISGRIVTAAGSSTGAKKGRFHPECFTCYHCSTPLECVSFYPEPDEARLERFRDALPHLAPDDEQVHSFASGVDDLHFFCHLDFHELFSPRCYSCKTPVEGAVILALGRHYHADHFFCAECGDVFTQNSPFVEHNNYPYCVACHTKRTSARCRACKKQILDEMTVEALGTKWHDACFVCSECGGDFGEEGRFFVREIQVELTDKERRKGLGPKFEERAACQACEERRVKNVDVFM